jgi:flavin-dependent dehydrogenase
MVVNELMNDMSVDVAVIGGGPSGAVAAALLRKRGHSVLVLERQRFPRFSIGESLLPQSMAYLEEAGMLQAVVQAGFQFKSGACFVRGGERSVYDFRDKSSSGWGTTYQVERAAFDQILIDCAIAAGAQVRFRHEVRAMLPGDQPMLEVVDENGAPYRVQARFVLDASGFGRILPRLLDLEAPTRLVERSALFTHVLDRIPAGSTDRDKIVIGVHPQHAAVWFWMIPLAHGKTSVGCVAHSAFLDVPEERRASLLRELIRSEPTIGALLGDAEFCMPPRHIGGYSANVDRLHGPGYALLGNAGEFLDPVFSSGVTIALRSAHLAVEALDRQLGGEQVDWQTAFDEPLRRGIDTFRAFVERWYSGRLQDIIFYPDQSASVRKMITSVLAGYAWDQDNPFVADAARRLDTLWELCADSSKPERAV